MTDAMWTALGAVGVALVGLLGGILTLIVQQRTALRMAREAKNAAEVQAGNAKKIALSQAEASAEIHTLVNSRLSQALAEIETLHAQIDRMRSTIEHLMVGRKGTEE